ncbi:geranylgeranylglyceryl/heptaprenylglyceryl phosphate synthase [Thermococci archaeon]|nr:MAG: geranylgeranylglyceryl/heptaprenylglyceryl phosphate synthase [Thermococci archaeon]RLF97395.1 MAG: geranylgeranylglyceryl/heptaprenylglyceryl phosphate synthase [Thermococci archaeon]
MSTLEYIERKLSEDGALHFSLIDPEKQDPEKAGEIASKLEEMGTDLVMVGGSTGAFGTLLDETVKEIKRSCSLPVVLFPGGIGGVSKYADAIFFMSLLNSRNPHYITGAQAQASFLVMKSGLEVIPMGYVVIEPGGAVGFFGEANLIPRDKPEIACSYALAAQLMGMKLVYLEAGSGARESVPNEMIYLVKKSINIPLIVGGGIRNPSEAKEKVLAGADIVVTGTMLERKPELLRETITSVKTAGLSKLVK